MQVLSVSYDEPLLRSREYLLQHLGATVSSAYGFTPALKACRLGAFELFVLGNSIPAADKSELIRAFRESSPGPVLELFSVNESPTGLADYDFDSSKHPSEFADLVRMIIERVPKARQQSS